MSSGLPFRQGRDTGVEPRGITESSLGQAQPSTPSECVHNTQFKLFQAELSHRKSNGSEVHETLL